MAQHDPASATAGPAPFRLDPLSGTLITDAGEVISLTRAEFRLLYVLLAHPDQVVSYQDLLHTAWSYADDESSRKLLAVYICRLRRKIEPIAQRPRYIITVRQQGYTFRH